MCVCVRVCVVTYKMYAAPETWSSTLQEASKLGELKVVPYDLEITYDFWNYRM